MRRLLAGRTRRTAALVAAASLLGTAGIAIAGPSGGFTGGLEPTGGIVKFGPINPTNGFPDWYRDVNGEEVEACLGFDDPNCNGPLEMPDPNSAVSFPDNFPEEFFYFTAEAALTANGANDVLALYTIEGTYGGGNTQTVFGRTRYRIRGGLQPGAEYTLTGPYGVDTMAAGDDGSIFITDDVGVGSGNFGELTQGHVGPFLKWDSGAPAGYLGDPTVDHTVTGSPFGTNFVKIEGPGIGGPGNPNPCPGQEATGSPDCIYTDLFSILGKKSTKGGVDVARASYSRGTAAGAQPQLDVIAESKAGQDIVVRDVNAGADRRFPITALETEQSRYFGRVDVQGDLPAEVEVVNRGDIPQTVKRVKVTDHVAGTALYDTGTDVLHVQAASSDKTAPLTDLKVAGFNKQMDSAGAADITTKAPTDTVTVTSTHGGSTIIPVEVQGPGLAPLTLQARAGADQSVEAGVTVELDGSTSTGNIDQFEWTGPAGIAITGASTAKARFTAPAAPGDYDFTLKVTGPDGTSAATATSSDTVRVHVNAVSTPQARIAFANAAVAPGGAIDVPQNLPITLDGGQSAGAASFSWTQTAGPAVALGTTNQSKLTFTFPKTSQNITLRLDVRNPDGVANGCTPQTCASTSITLRPVPDTLGIDKARFVATGARWVIDGTATSTTSNKVQVYSGLAINPAMRIGTSDVLADGTWSVDARDSTIPTTTCACVTVVSDRGGQIVGFQLEKPQNLPPTTVDPGTAAAAAAAAGPSALAAAVPLAGAPAAARLGAPRVAAPATVNVAAVGTTGVPVTVNVPAGASVVRLRVLSTSGTSLFSTFRSVKGGSKVRLMVRSSKLRHRLRAGKRYVVEVRAGTARNRLGTATRRVIRMR